MNGATMSSFSINFAQGMGEAETSFACGTIGAFPATWSPSSGVTNDPTANA
jgi:hypothetical protein